MTKYDGREPARPSNTLKAVLVVGLGVCVGLTLAFAACAGLVALPYIGQALDENLDDAVALHERGISTARPSDPEPASAIPAAVRDPEEDRLTELRAINLMRGEHWQASTFTDPMTDARVYFAQIVALGDGSNSVDPVTLNVRCTDGKGLEVFIDWNQYLSDQFVARIRHDKAEPESLMWSTSTDSTALFAMRPKQLLEDLAETETFVARVSPYRSGPVTATFEVLRPEAIVNDALAMCPDGSANEQEATRLAEEKAREDAEWAERHKKSSARAKANRERRAAEEAAERERLNREMPPWWKEYDRAMAPLLISEESVRAALNRDPVLANNRDILAAQEPVVRQVRNAMPAAPHEATTKTVRGMLDAWLYSAKSAAVHRWNDAGRYRSEALRLHALLESVRSE